MNHVVTPLSRALFQSISLSNIGSSDQYYVTTQKSGSYSEMSFTPSNFSNMRRDQRSLEEGRDSDLVLERFAGLKVEDPPFSSIILSIILI